MNDVDDTTAALIRARYGRETGIAAPRDDVLASLLAHRSVRAFLPDALAPGTLEALVAAAQSAATSSNLQAWSVVAVQDPDRRARLAELAGGQAHVAAAPLFLAWIADLHRLRHIAAARGEPSEGTDHLETMLVAVIDATLAAQNAVVALEARGLGCVYIGGMRNHPEAVAAELGLPPGAFVVFGLAVGHPDPARPASVKPRLPQGAVLFHERYDWGERQAQDVAAYDATLAAFQAGEAMPARGWTGPSVRRVRDAAALQGRDRLRAALAALGFRLL